MPSNSSSSSNPDPHSSAVDAPPPSPAATYLGFDRNIYPGDDALPTLRKTFAFSGFWLGPPPGEKSNTWRGKHQLMQSLGFGFVALYCARRPNEVKRDAQAREKGSLDAHNAAAAAKTEGFAPHTIIFLDIEDGGRLTPTFHTYLRVWADELTRAGYRPVSIAPEFPSTKAASQFSPPTTFAVTSAIASLSIGFTTMFARLRLGAPPQRPLHRSLLAVFHMRQSGSSPNRHDLKSAPRSARLPTQPTEIVTRQAIRLTRGFSI
jgi:hypothetical protein